MSPSVQLEGRPEPEGRRIPASAAAGRPLEAMVRNLLFGHLDCESIEFHCKAILKQLGLPKLNTFPMPQGSKEHDLLFSRHSSAKDD